jgi:hypothetical protein
VKEQRLVIILCNTYTFEKNKIVFLLKPGGKPVYVCIVQWFHDGKGLLIPAEILQVVQDQAIIL